MKITILVDNQVGDGLIAEHGLSMWIETSERCILFDTGQKDALEYNAQRLGVDLSRADMLVLSHGHYDHTGAIPYVLQQAPHVPIYAHPEVTHLCYSMKTGHPKSIQMPQKSIEAINNLPRQQLHGVQEPLWLSENMGLTGPIPRETDYEDTGGAFFLDQEGQQPDPIKDDLALWIKTDTGLVVCVGCCHAGLVNTLRYIQQVTKGQKIRAVIGGFHLLNASQHRLDQTIAALQVIHPATLIPCHCTGEYPTAVLCDTFGECVSPGKAGSVYAF